MCKLRIDELRKERGLKVADVARAAGYRQATSLNQKMARTGLTTDQLEAIAKLFKVEVYDLFEHRQTTITCPHCGKIITIKTE